MIPEVFISKACLRNQQVVRRRRGRPRNADRDRAGTVTVTLELSEAEAVGLGMIATTSNVGARESEYTLRAQIAPYLLDLAGAHLAERFPDRFGVSLGEFFSRLSAARAAGAEPQFVIARVLANLRPDGGVM